MSTPNRAAEEANARLRQQSDLYNFGGGKSMHKIQDDIREIRKSVQEITELLTTFIKSIQNNG